MPLATSQVRDNRLQEDTKSGEGPAKQPSANAIEALQRLQARFLRPGQTPDLGGAVREMHGMLAPDPATVQKPLPAEPIAIDALAHQPFATETILNAQLLEAVALVRDAGWLYRNVTLCVEERGDFIGHAGKIMDHSAKLADSIRGLRSGAEPVKTTRHITVVEHVAPAVGGEPAIPENE